MTASLLLIDVAPSAFSRLRPALQREGYRVAFAEPGLRAIRRVLADAPDLVILGIDCQRGDWAFCSRLLAVLDKPLLLLLSTSNPMDQVRGLELGADDCMIRPVAVIELLARVRALLRRYEFASRRAERFHFVDDDLAIDLPRQQVWLTGWRLLEREQERELLLAQVATPESQKAAHTARQIDAQILDTFVEELQKDFTSHRVTLRNTLRHVADRIEFRKTAGTIYRDIPAVLFAGTPGGILCCVYCKNPDFGVAKARMLSTANGLDTKPEL